MIGLGVEKFPMLVRFVVRKRDRDSLVEQGLIHAAEELRYMPRLAEHEVALVREVFRWFNHNLPVPPRLARSRKPHALNRAICWFKPTAKEFIAHMQTLAVVLEEHGHHTERLTTDRPGYVVYEDEHQVVAEVFRAEYKM
jgi:hypothetical protein